MHTCRYCAEPPCGQFNPAAGNKTYNLVETIMHDMTALFPDPHIHLGYDEVNFPCWQNNVVANTYMAVNGLDARALLQEYFEEQRRRLHRIAPNRRPIYWEEVSVARLPLTSSDTVQVWSNKSVLRSVLSESEASVLVSWAQDYYLDCGRGNMFGGSSWCDPYNTAVDT